MDTNIRPRRDIPLSFGIAQSSGLRTVWSKPGSVFRIEGEIARRPILVFLVFMTFLASTKSSEAKDLEACRKPVLTKYS